MENKNTTPESEMQDHHSAMIVDCAGYEKGQRICTLAIQDAHAWVTHPDRFVWVGLHEPSKELLHQVQRQFALHDLAVEDAFNAHQRPKLEFYGDALFLVLHTAQRKNGAIEFGETHVFAGRGYVVSVRHGVSSSYRELRAKCERMPAMLAKGADFVVYSLIDFVVDNYMPIIDEMEDEAEEIEKGILSSHVDRQMVQRVHELRCHLRTLHSMSSPLIDICNRLARFDSGLIDNDVRPYFRDVHDHVIRIDGNIDALRDMLSSALEANIMIASVEQNEVMKKLAAYAAMLAVPTAVAGIYGMNFEFMPELHWKYGYVFALGIMGGVCAYLYRRFVKAGWL
ncbi:MAG TPA: magnesium/cobalt transporter CorA [Pseudomonadales bacterium]|jgi:magnesium transporter|nr:magnesium/cobalt transporter CorA [Pseudomonadales bacterium]